MKLEESATITKKVNSIESNKKKMKLTAVAFFILLIMAIAIYITIQVLDKKTFKVYLDNVRSDNLKTIFATQEGTNKKLVNINELSKILGYDYADGGYLNRYKPKDNEFHMVNTFEAVSFSFTDEEKSKIYKVVINNGNEKAATENIKQEIALEDSLILIGREYYLTLPDASKAFNITFSENTETNTIKINTLDYIVDSYNQAYEDSALAEEDMFFSNKKAILYGYLVVRNEVNGQITYGVKNIGNEGSEILISTRDYSSVEFDEGAQEFIVRSIASSPSDEKVGIIAINRTFNSQTKKYKVSKETKIEATKYISIKKIDVVSNLYLVENSNNKYGVVNSREKVVIPVEYDQIGIDPEDFPLNFKEQENNPYFLYDSCIPAKIGNYWVLIDREGINIAEKYGRGGMTTFKSIGCVVTSEPTEESLLLVEDPQKRWKGIVVRSSDNYYGVISSEGEQLIPCATDKMYAIFDAGERSYNMFYDGGPLPIIKTINDFKYGNSSVRANSDIDVNNNNNNNNEEYNNQEEQNQNNDQENNDPNQYNGEQDPNQYNEGQDPNQQQIIYEQQQENNNQ